MSSDDPFVAHVYIPFGGVADQVKRGILDKLNAPNEEFGFEQPALIFGPSYNDALSTAGSVPDHSQLKFKFVVEKECERAKALGTGESIFIWAEGSALQAKDPSVRVIYVTPSDSGPVVEELRASIDAVAGVVNCVDSGNQSFGECQDWAGADGIVRAGDE